MSEPTQEQEVLEQLSFPYWWQKVEVELLKLGVKPPDEQDTPAYSWWSSDHSPESAADRILEQGVACTLAVLGWA